MGNRTNRQASDLPPGWVCTTLGEIADIKDSQRVPINADEREQRIASKKTDDVYPYFGATGQVGWIDSYLFDEELVLLGEDGAPFLDPGKSKAYIIRGRTWVNNHAHVLRANSDFSTNSYLMHFLNVFDYHGYVTGTTRLKLNQSEMRKIPIPLPPLPEQGRIVAEIEEQFTRLDAGVAALKRVQANLKRYRASVLKAACEGRLAPQDPADEPADRLLARVLAERRAKWEAEHPGKKYVEPAAPATDGLPELPAGWCWATVEQVSEHRLGKMLDQVKNRGTLRPYLRNINVRWFRFDFSDIQEMRVTDEEINDISVRIGDLVVCEGGEPGRAAVWTSTQESMVIQKALHRVRPTQGISSWYLAYRLAADAMSGQLERYFTGSTIKHFTGQSLRSYIFPVPPTEEQHRIVIEVERRLSVVTELEAAVVANLARAGRLRQAVLKRAFEGRLVAQDTGDKPAQLREAS